MRWKTVVVAVVLAMCTIVPAAAWEVPARGSALRSDLMDAARPHAEWMLGAPVEFVVTELRVSGDLALAMLVPQRPGGGAIDVLRTPDGGTRRF